MSPVDFAVLAACALLVAVAVGAAVALRLLLRRSRALEHAVASLATRVEELCRRESGRETAEAATADWVIAFDDPEPGPTVSTQQVVSTTLGEPLIKVAALSHGVRHALREEKRAHLAYQVRREYRRRRRVSRARARSAQQTTQGSAQGSTQ